MLQNVEVAAAGAARHDHAAARAGVVARPGAEPEMRTVAFVPREAGTTLVQVAAAPVNPLDLTIASGTFHSVRHEAAYVPGSECVGLVLESERHEPGTWVYAETHASPSSPGTFAARVQVDDDAVLVLPAGVDPVAAAAVGNAGCAAFLPLVQRAGLQAGETVVVLGATGAVGQLAVQVARAHGAGRVIGVGRDHATLQTLFHLGADAVVDLRVGETSADLAVRLRAVTGAADVVLDGLYGDPLVAALQVCAPGARVVNIGNAAGATAEIPAGALRGKQLTLSGFAGLHTPLSQKEVALTWLWTALLDGKLEVEVDTFALEDLPVAWRRQASSPHRKCVVVPGGAPRPATDPDPDHRARETTTPTSRSPR